MLLLVHFVLYFKFLISVNIFVILSLSCYFAIVLIIDHVYTVSIESVLFFCFLFLCLWQMLCKYFRVALWYSSDLKTTKISDIQDTKQHSQLYIKCQIIIYSNSFMYIFDGGHLEFRSLQEQKLCTFIDHAKKGLYLKNIKKKFGDRNVFLVDNHISYIIVWRYQMGNQKP